jgi:hypothetical protein
LWNSTEKVRNHVREKLKPDNLGVIDYFNFRSQAEQAALREKAWR